MINKPTSLSDAILPVSVIAVIGIMILPLPNFLLDLLLTCSIASSLVLIVGCVYLASPERFTSLPALLLLSTLFRLGLNISTTRQILSTGQAPHVVATFGNFVTQGNLIVGMVIFSIVTIIQFLVITKGAERVAEVAARFTLDAMPGKQMAIDADIRAGLLSANDARERRYELQRESKLYGALDGAMKFIKGDCLAGILIIVVNIFAGILVGSISHGLSISESIHRYVVFAIGDGICSQIPALLVAVSAGIVVTRVSDRNSPFLGRDIFQQITKEPQGISLSGVVLILLATIPGFPKLSFFAIGLTLFLGARIIKQQQSEEQSSLENAFNPKLLSELVVRVTPRLVLKLQEEHKIVELLARLKEKVFESYGILIPDVQFEIDRNTTIVGYTVWLQGRKMDERSFVDIPDSSFSLTLVNDIEIILLPRISDLLDDTQIRILLDLHSPSCEDLINSVIPSVISVTALTQICKQLLRERVSVREIPRILQAVSNFKLRSEHGELLTTAPGISAQQLATQIQAVREANGFKNVLGEIYADIRESLGRSIVGCLTDTQGVLSAWILNSDLEKHLTEVALGGSMLSSEVASLLGAEIENKESSHNAPLIIITSRYSRPVLQSIVIGLNAEVQVLSFAEIPAEYRVNFLGCISLVNNPNTLESKTCH